MVAVHRAMVAWGARWPRRRGMANGQRYDGSWKNNRKDGSGNMRFPDGGSYDGDWRDDRATGRATSCLPAATHTQARCAMAWRTVRHHALGFRATASRAIRRRKADRTGRDDFPCRSRGNQSPAGWPSRNPGAPPPAANATPAGAPSRTSLCAAAFQRRTRRRCAESALLIRF